MSNYVPGFGPKDAPIIWVGEAPGADEDAAQIPFVGRSGQFLDDQLQEISREVLGYRIRLGDCYRTNVVKYRPPENNLDRLSEIGHTISEGVPQLWQELGDIKSNVIIPLGNLSLLTVCGKGTGGPGGSKRKPGSKKKEPKITGIMKWRGSILPTLNLNRKAVPTIHPAALLRAMSGRESSGSKGGLDARFKYIWRMDIARAIEESRSPIYSPPSPQLEVIRDHVNFQRYIDRYQGSEILSVDIEVVKSIPVCIGFAFTRDHGVCVPLLDLMSWQNEEGIPASELARLWKMVAWLLENKKIIGQNFKFDHQALDHICKMPVRQVFADVMIMAHSLYPEFEKKLAFHTSIWTRHPYYKDDGKEFNIKREDFRKFMIYCARDAVVEYELFEIFYEQAGNLKVPGFPDWRKEFMIDYTMQLHDFYRRMENVGFQMNLKKQRELVDEYLGKLETCEVELDRITGGGINYGSHPQIRRLLFRKPTDEKGFPGSFGLPERASTDEDSLIAVAANNAKRPEHKRGIELILDNRRIRKALGTYFLASPDFDGRMRTSYRICGTETGRSSTGVLKPPVRPKKVGLAFQTMTKHGDLGPEVRSEFEADPGYSIVETDMSQAEARIVALLGNDEKSLELFRTGQDIHSITAKWIFGLSEEAKVIKSKYPEMRFIGKTTRHAGNYDMQAKRLMEIVNTDAKKFKLNVSISQWKAGKILGMFHDFAPNIRKVFHEEVRGALRSNNRVLVNPFGRYRQFFGEEGGDLEREAYAHIPQSTVPDHLRKAGLRVEAHFKNLGLYERMTQYDSIFCLEGHDSLIALIRTEFVEQYIQVIHKEIEVPIDFSRCTIPRGSIVIPAESKVGRNYMECKVRNCKGCDYLHEYQFPVAA